MRWTNVLVSSVLDAAAFGIGYCSSCCWKWTRFGLHLGGLSVQLCGGGDEVERHDVGRLAVATVRARTGELRRQHVTHHGRRRRRRLGHHVTVWRWRQVTWSDDVIIGDVVGRKKRFSACDRWRCGGSTFLSGRGWGGVWCDPVTWHADTGCLSRLTPRRRGCRSILRHRHHLLLLLLLATD